MAYHPHLRGAPKRDDPRSAHPGRILVVDDDTFCADLLAAASRWHPTVAVLDLSMPDIDGFEPATQLQADPDNAGLRLIALTSDGDEETGAACLAAGFRERLIKGVPLDVLLAAVAGESRSNCETTRSSRRGPRQTPRTDASGQPSGLTNPKEIES